MGFFELVITLYIGAMTYFANLADANTQHRVETIDAQTTLVEVPYAKVVRRMLFVIVGLVILFGLYACRILTLDLPSETLEEFGISPEAMTLSSIVFITLLVGALSSVSLALINSTRIREYAKYLTGSTSGYNPNSQVHLIAMVLALCLISYLLINYVITGGLQGVAKSIEEDGLSITTLIFQGVMFVIIAILGVGLYIRRNLNQTLERLGLFPPSPQNILTGLLAGFIMIGISLLMTRVWVSTVTAQQYAEQSAAAAEISNQINTVQAAFVLALTAAISEEVLFRGALQPIFGLPLTTLLFVAFHDQYTLTPAMLIIFTIGAGLALLRRYQGTTAAIIAHFIYNFVPILIVITLPQVAQTLGLS